MQSERNPGCETRRAGAFASAERLSTRSFREIQRTLIACAALLLSVLTGCLSHTRKLQKISAPAVVQTADAGQLVASLNKEYAAINSMTATVDFKASVGGARKGKVTDYTSFRGYILLQKPEKLRVLGLIPVVRTTAFDLASDGSTFKLLIPPQHKAIEGSNSVEQKSANPFLNLRPQIFFDSMLIRRIAADEQVILTTDSNTLQDPKTKLWFEEQDYLLSIVRSKGDTPGPNPVHQLVPVRVIRFNRFNLLPVEQDIYDKNGAIETQTLYGPQQTFGNVNFPGTVTIKRPLEEYQFTLTIQKLVLNQHLADDQFELKIPEGTAVQRLN